MLTIQTKILVRIVEKISESTLKRRREVGANAQEEEKVWRRLHENEVLIA
jgi:hypothetical protein